MGLEAIPPDQKAVLQLVLQQGRSYDEIAGLLGIEGQTVRRRAHDALATLGPAVTLDATDQARIADYLLGQQGVSEREATRDLLSASGSARDWANSAASALDELAPGSLPEIPSGGAPPPPPPPPPPEPPRRAEREPEPPPRRREPEPAPVRDREPEADDERAAFSYFPDESGRRSPPAAASPRARSSSSRLGGAIILAGIGIVLAVVLILILSGGDDDEPSPVATSTTQTTGASGATGATGAPAPIAQIDLRPADGSQAEGLAQIFARGRDRAVIVAGQGVKPGAYALWLFNEGGSSKLLGFVPNRVGNDGRFVTQGGLPSDASKYKEMIITRESVSGSSPQLPKTPGTIILRGQLRGISGSS